MGNYEAYMKRFFDIVFAIILLVLLSPLFVIVAISIRIKLGGPVLFQQPRVGRNEQLFTLYKFRSMTNAVDEQGELLPVSRRLTAFGQLLRETSVDELPELINILKGDMSFIGPRPLVVDYLPYYTNEERQRHSVRPGLTGLAQVNGRCIASWQQRFMHDLAYVRHITFIQDVKIIWKTLFVVLKRSNIGRVGVDTPIDLDILRQTESSSIVGGRDRD